MEILNNKRYKILNKIIFNRIAEIIIRVSYEVTQKQHFQSKKKSGNLQKFFVKTLKLMTSEKKTAKIRNSSEKGLIVTG